VASVREGEASVREGVTTADDGVGVDFGVGVDVGVFLGSACPSESESVTQFRLPPRLLVLGE
jgi:hypothetical protein